MQDSVTIKEGDELILTIAGKQAEYIVSELWDNSVFSDNSAEFTLVRKGEPELGMPVEIIINTKSE